MSHINSIFNIITIIGSTGLIIIGIILVISLNTPIYGYSLIGTTILALCAFILYQKVKLYNKKQSAIRDYKSQVLSDNELCGVSVQPHIIQLDGL
jgi:hypothetical protein